MDFQENKVVYDLLGYKREHMGLLSLAPYNS